MGPGGIYLRGEIEPLVSLPLTCAEVNKRGAVRIKHSTLGALHNHCYRGKAVSITYSEWVSVALVIQHAMRMLRIVLPTRNLSGCTMFFPHYLINGTIFGIKAIGHKSVFSFPLQILSATFLILRRTERDMVKTLRWSSCKVPVTCQLLIKL